MSEDENNDGGNPPPDGQSPPPPGDGGSTPPPAAKPRKKRKLRIVLGIVAALVVIIGIVVVFAPSIASTGFVRDLVVSKINEGSINGKLEIQNWSLGWNSGMVVEGVRLSDASGKKILDIQKVTTGLSLLHALKGNYDLGDVEILGDFVIHLFRSGQTNIAQTFKTSPQPASPTPSQAGKLPEVSGNIHLKLTGTLEQDVEVVTDGVARHSTVVVDFDSIESTVKIKGINEPIEDSLNITMRPMHQTTGTIKVSGTLAAIHNNQLDAIHATGSQTIELANLDVGPFAPVLAQLKLPYTVAGELDGTLKAESSSPGNAMMNGQFTLNKPSVSGEILSGDTLGYQKIQMNITASQVTTGSGSPQIKLDLPIVATSASGGAPDQINVHVDAPRDAMMQVKDVFAAVADRLRTGQAGAVVVAQGGNGTAQVSVQIDAANLARQLPHALQLKPNEQIQTGQLIASASLAPSGDQKIVASAEAHLKDFSGSTDGKPFRLDNIDAAFGAKASGGASPDLTDITLNTTSSFLNIKGGGASLANIDVSGDANLRKLQQQAAQVSDAVPSDLDGTLTFKLHTAGDFTKPQSKVQLSADMAVDQLTHGALHNEKLHLVAGGALSTDFSRVDDAVLNVDSTFAKKLSLANGIIVLKTRQGDKLVPASVVDMLQSADVDVQEVDLAKIDNLMNLAQAMPGRRMGPIFAAWPAVLSAAVVSPAETAKPLPPAQVTGGLLTLQAHVLRQGTTSTANVSQLLVHGLALQRDQTTYTSSRDITGHLTLDAQTQNDPTGQASLLAQLQQLSVSALSLDLAIGQVNLQKPIVITNFDSRDLMKLAVDGSLVVDLDFDPTSRMLEAVGGSPLYAYPYRGHFHFEPSVQKSAGQTQLAISGPGSIKPFQVLDNANNQLGNPVFQEDEVAIQSDLAYDVKTDSVIINSAKPISISLKSTGALGVEIAGTIADVMGQRNMQGGVNVAMNYDLEKLWPIIKPMLSSDQQKSYADLIITGKHKQQFTLGGSYPASPASGKAALAYLNASGVLAIDRFYTHGIELQAFEAPFVLNSGILRTVYPGQAEGKNAPKAAACNSGTLDIGILRVDLTGNTMYLTMEGADPQHPHQLLKNVTLNPAFSKTFLGNLLNNPAFQDTSDSSGLFDLAVLDCRNLPLSSLLLQKSPENTGTFEAHYSARQMRFGSPLLQQIRGVKDSVPAEINDADVRLAAGELYEDTTLMIDKTKPMRINGTVVLQTNQLQNMTIAVPVSLLGNLISDPTVIKFMPDQLVVPLEGNASSPTLRLEATLNKAVQDAAAKAVPDLLQGLFGGKGQPAK